MACGIYQWVNKVNRKRYIGSGVKIERRRSQHLSALRFGCHGNDHFQAAWNEYGEDQFSFEILRECDPDDLLMWEQTYIDCYEPEALYNLNLEVDRPPSCSEETRRKMSEARKGRSHTEETLRKLSEARKTRVFTDETRRRISESKRTITDETRRKMSESHKGKVFTDETRRKISESKRTITDETRRRISEGQKRRAPITDETRRKLSEANKGRVFTDEARRKMSESAKNRRRRVA